MMIDGDEQVFGRILQETKKSEPQRFIGKNAGNLVCKKLFLKQGETDIEIGVVSRHKRWIYDIDAKHSAVYVTDHSVEPPVRRWIIDTPIGRYTQVVEIIGHEVMQNENVIQPFMPMSAEDSFNVAQKMLDLLNRVAEPKRSEIRPTKGVIAN